MQRCSALLPVIAQWITSPSGPESHFSTDRRYKRDVCKTVDATPPGANTVSYDSFYYEFLIHRGFKTWAENSDFKISDVIITLCWAGTQGQGLWEKHYCVYIMDCITSQASVLIGLNKHHLGILFLLYICYFNWQGCWCINNRFRFTTTSIPVSPS